MVDPYELLFSGGIETVPDWFAGGDMLGAGRLCFLGYPLGRRCVAREWQRFPGVCACHPRPFTIGDRFEHPCAPPSCRPWIACIRPAYPLSLRRLPGFFA